MTEQGSRECDGERERERGGEVRKDCADNSKDHSL